MRRFLGRFAQNPLLEVCCVVNMGGSSAAIKAKMLRRLNLHRLHDTVPTDVLVRKVRALAGDTRLSCRGVDCPLRRSAFLSRPKHCTHLVVSQHCVDTFAMCGRWSKHSCRKSVELVLTCTTSLTCGRSAPWHCCSMLAGSDFTEHRR